MKSESRDSNIAWGKKFTSRQPLFQNLHLLLYQRTAGFVMKDAFNLLELNYRRVNQFIFAIGIAFQDKVIPVNKHKTYYEKF